MRSATRRPASCAAALGVTLLVPLLGAGCSEPALKDGPLHILGGDATVTLETEVGQVVAYGFNVMTNKGTSSITNISVELVPPSGGAGIADGISFEPPVVVDIGSLDMGYLGADRWPNQDWAKHAKPLQGFTLTPTADGRVELLVIARVTESGRWLWAATHVEYDYNGVHYAEQVTNGFSVCAPAPCSLHPAD